MVTETLDGVTPSSIYGFKPLDTATVNPAGTGMELYWTAGDAQVAYVTFVQSNAIAAARTVTPRFVIDGNTVTGAGIAANDSALYYLYLDPVTEVITGTAVQTLAAVGLPIYAKSFQLYLQVNSIANTEVIIHTVRWFGT